MRHTGRGAPAQGRAQFSLDAESPDLDAQRHPPRHHHHAATRRLPHTHSPHAAAPPLPHAKTTSATCRRPSVGDFEGYNHVVVKYGCMRAVLGGAYRGEPSPTTVANYAADFVVSHTQIYETITCAEVRAIAAQKADAIVRSLVSLGHLPPKRALT